MIRFSSGTTIESAGWNVIALVYLADGDEGPLSRRLFHNFLISCRHNAPVFAKNKLLVVTFDVLSNSYVKSLGHEHVLLVHNMSTDRGSVSKFLLLESFLQFNISVLLMEADQIVLSNPFSGFRGDADLELTADFPRPSLIFKERGITAENSKDIADNANIGNMRLIHMKRELIFLLFFFYFFQV